MGKKRDGDNHFKPLEVSPRAGEPIEKAIKRFMKKVRNDGILQEVFLRRSYQKPSVKKKQKAKKAQYRREQEEKS